MQHHNLTVQYHSQYHNHTVHRLMNYHKHMFTSPNASPQLPTLFLHSQPTIRHQQVCDMHSKQNSLRQEPKTSTTYQQRFPEARRWTKLLSGKETKHTHRSWVQQWQTIARYERTMILQTAIQQMEEGLHTKTPVLKKPPQTNHRTAYSNTCIRPFQWRRTGIQWLSCHCNPMDQA